MQKSHLHATRALAAAAALALAACAAQPVGSFDPARFSADSGQAHGELYFQPGGPQLAAGEAARVTGFLRALVLRPQDDILVYVDRTGSDVLDAQRLATLRAALAGGHARLRVVRDPGFSRPEPRPDVATIVVQRYDRVNVTCPGTALDTWERDVLTPLPDLGCANGLNLANMAAEPRDLTDPRRLQGASAVTGAAAVDRYRAGKVKTTAKPVGTGG